jgi:hypothetical protein
MMKKLLLFSSAVLAFCFAANSQNAAKQGPKGTKSIQVSYTSASPGSKIASTPTVVTDQLHYYLNKYYFKTATTDLNQFPQYKSAASTVTSVTHCGSRFDVPAGDSIIVTGLEAYAKFPLPGHSASSNIPIHILLCNLNSNGMPVLPPIDSVMTSVNASSSGTHAAALIGGNFTSTTPRVLKNSFAVLFRNMSTISGDTALLLRTAGATATNSAALPSDRCSDTENGKDYGYVRFNGAFYSTRDFTLAGGFGIGTQYEFVVAPRVTYSIQASEILPQGVVATLDSVDVPDTMCTRTLLTFTNTSSGFYEHRMYNLNQFYRKWNLYSAFPSSVAGAFSPDSSLTWYFEFYDAANPPKESRVFLPYVNNHTISAITDLSYYPNCFTANEFRARLKPMAALGSAPQLIFNQGFTVCFKYCNGDTVGISSIKGYDNLKIYPNPAVNGKTLVSGLRGKNTIVVYDVLGQQVYTEVTESPNVMVDLSKQPKGTYVMRIVNSDNQYKSVKIINQNQ